MGDFSRLGVDDLHPMAVVAQSLDNQWVPGALLRRMVGEGLELADVRDALREGIRGEYVRALINSPQVVINRAFLYNNPVVFEDFASEGPDRDAFLSLVESGAIVQMLLGERTPADPPAVLDDPTSSNYTMLRDGWDAWRQVAERAHVHSLKFSWDNDTANVEQIRRRLATAFTQRAQTLVNLHGPALADDLGVDLDTALGIKGRLADVAARCAELASRDRFATRESMYAEFVTAPGTDPALGRFDRDKPYAAEVKQLIDLAYNVNLATGLETLALTPSQALHRSTLQEWEAVKRSSAPVSAAQLAELLRGTAFDLVQEQLYLDTFAKLSMRDVRDARASEQWAAYVSRMEGLLASPLTRFGDPETGAPAVVAAYVDLLGEVTRIAGGRRRPERPRNQAREFAAVIGIEVAGAVLEYHVFSGGVWVAVAGAVAAPFLSEAARLTVRLGVRAMEGRERRRLNAALDSRTQVLSGWVSSGGAFWAELTRELRDLPGMDEVRHHLESAAATAENDPYQDLHGVLD